MSFNINEVIMRNENDRTIPENNTTERDFLIPIPSDISASSEVYRNEAGLPHFYCYSAAIRLLLLGSVSYSTVVPSSFLLVRLVTLMNVLSLLGLTFTTGLDCGFFSAKAKPVQDQNTQTLENLEPLADARSSA